MGANTAFMPLRVRILGACLLTSSALAGCSGSSADEGPDLALRSEIASAYPGTTFATLGSSLAGVSAWNVSLSREASAVVVTGVDDSETAQAQFAVMIDDQERPVGSSYRIASGRVPVDDYAAVVRDLAANQPAGSTVEHGKAAPDRVRPDDLVSTGKSLVSAGSTLLKKVNKLYEGADLVWSTMCGQSLVDSLPGIGLGMAASAGAEVGIDGTVGDGVSTSGLAAQLGCPNAPPVSPVTPAPSSPATAGGGSSGSASGGSSGPGN